MRPILRLLETRYGIALVLLLLVLGVVAAFRVTSGPDSAKPMGPALEPSRTVSVEPFGGDDGVVEDADATTPSVTGPSTAAATQTANRFATAWLKHVGVTAEQWRAGMTPHSTASLMTKLAETEPSGVPADRVTGDVELVVRDPTLAEATIPVDSGTLRLRLLATNGRWKVDAVDWERPT